MAEIFDFGFQKYRLKLSGVYNQSGLFAVAGDTARRVEVQLLDAAGRVTDTTGIELSLSTAVGQSSSYVDANLIDASKGLYQVDLTNGLFLKPGKQDFQWTIHKDGKQINSVVSRWHIYKNVSDGGNQSFNFYLNLDDLKRNLKDVKDIQTDLIEGTIDSTALQQNVESRFGQLESDYAQDLSKLKQNDAELTTQLAHLTQQTAETVFVGEGGDFETINEAIAYFSTRRVEYSRNGYSAEIRLLSGFIMREQVFVDALNLGYIEISSEDEQVFADASSLTGSMQGDDRINARPLFGVRGGGVLPEINVLFNMIDDGSTDLNKHGFFVIDNSQAHIRPGKGCLNAVGNGIYVVNGGKVLSFGGVYDNARASGVRAFRGSYLNIRKASIKNAGEYGIYFGSSSKVVGLGADFSGATLDGIWAYNLATGDFRDGKTTDCGRNGAVIDHSSIISLGNNDLSRSGRVGLIARDGAIVDIHNTKINNSAWSGIEARSGARITGKNVELNENGVHGVFANSSEVVIQEATVLNNTTHGVFANRGGRINVDKGNINGNGENDVMISHGSTIVATQLTGEPTFNVQTNTLSSAGTIFET